MDKVYNRGRRFGSKTYLLDGKNYSASELSEKYGLKTNTIYARLKKGWSVLDACTKPLVYRGRHLAKS